MGLIPEWAPNLHPLIIHFPIALLVVAAVLDGFGLVVSRWSWLPIASAVLYAVGSLSAVVAWLTGRVAADSVFVTAEAQSLLSAHADWALWTMLFFVLLASIRVVMATRKWDSFSLRAGTFAAGLLGVFMLFQTGDRGARMVFGYGVGTGALTETRAGGEVDPTGATGVQGAETRVVRGLRIENGSWYWQAGPGALGDLLTRFEWLDGRPDELAPRLVQYPDSSYAIEWRLEGETVFLASDEPFGDVQVDLEVDLTAFDGEIGLVHHVQSPDTYDYLELGSDNAMSLGRRVGETTRIVENITLDASSSGILALSAVGSGTHFRGYLDRELVIHGHGDEANAGGAGLRIHGRGTLRIRRLDLRAPDGG